MFVKTTVSIKMPFSFFAKVTVISASCALVGWALNHQAARGDDQPNPSPGCISWSTDCDSWTSEAWSGNDAPYTEARLRIEREVDASHEPISVANSYKLKATTSPSNPLVVFSWAVAAYEASRSSKSDAEYLRCTAGVLKALAISPSPDTYEYDRMRYLVQLDGYDEMPDLAGLGDRLLKHNKNDPDVLLQVAVSKQDLKTALALANASLLIKPNTRAAYGDFGEIYMDHMYLPGKKALYGRAAIAAFEKCLELLPPNKDARNWLRSNISWCRSQVSAAAVQTK